MDLVEKIPEGLYHITDFSKQVLSLVPAYRFLTENRKYFKIHSMEELPNEFITRISELLGCYLENDLMTFFHNVE